MNRPTADSTVKPTADSKTARPKPSSRKGKSPVKRGKKDAAAQVVWDQNPKDLAPVQDAHLPILPEDALPEPLTKLVHGVSEVFRQPTAAVSVLLYFFASAALGKSVQVQDSVGCVRSLNVALGLFVDRGNQCLEMVRVLSDRFSSTIDTQINIYNATYKTLLDEARIYKNKVARLRTSTDVEKVDEVVKTIGELERKLDEMKFPPVPGHLVSDPLQVNVVERMQQHGSCGAILSQTGLPVVQLMRRHPALYNALLRGERVETAATVEGLPDPFLSVMLFLPSNDAPTVFASEQSSPLDNFCFVQLTSANNFTKSDYLNFYEVEDDVDQLIGRLIDIRNKRVNNPMVLRFTSEAEEARRAYAERLQEAADSREDAETDMVDPEQIMVLATKLAGLSHVIETGDSSDEVSVTTWLKAEQFADYFLAHTEIVRRSAVENAAMAFAKLILKRADKLGDQFTSSDVLTKAWRGLNDSAQISAALNILVDYGYLQKVQRTHGPSGGRPTTAYHWWPGVLSKDVVKPSGNAEGADLEHANLADDSVDAENPA